MPYKLLLHEFLSQSGPICDVRSPSEFKQGRIPGSISIPLFNDDERAQIGTVYKKISKQEAVSLGLILAAPKLEQILVQYSSLLQDKGKILCWRGGMRSDFTAKLLELVGYTVSTLHGGYKSYRRWVLQYLQNFSCPDFRVLGGLTGSGKTAILQALHKRGEQVVDLEFIAQHSGSAFGGIGWSEQPSQEQFENELAWRLSSLDLSRPIWIEDESRLIGSCHLPNSLVQEIMRSRFYYIDVPIEERLENLMGRYGHAPKEELVSAVKRISKRLGSQLSHEIIHSIESGQCLQAFESLIIYYDRTYQYQISKRSNIHRIKLSDNSSADARAKILQHDINKGCINEKLESHP